MASFDTKAACTICSCWHFVRRCWFPENNVTARRLFRDYAMGAIERHSGFREWFWPAALAVAIFFASARSQVASPDLPGIDKAVHFLVYGLLGTLIARVPAVAHWKPLGVSSAILMASLYGLTDEWHQSFTPGRSVEWLDWIMDAAGATVAVTVYVRWTAYRALLERACLPGTNEELSHAARPPSTS